jgi:hypothetical protein
MSSGLRRSGERATSAVRRGTGHRPGRACPRSRRWGTRPSLLPLPAYSFVATLNVFRCECDKRPRSPGARPILRRERSAGAEPGAVADVTGGRAPPKVRHEPVAAVQRQPLGRWPVPGSRVGIARRGEPGGLRCSGYSSPQVDGFAGRWSPGGAPSTVSSATVPPRAAPTMPPTIAPGGPPTTAPVTSPAMAPAIAPPNAASP